MFYFVQVRREYDYYIIIILYYIIMLIEAVHRSFCFPVLIKCTLNLFEHLFRKMMMMTPMFETGFSRQLKIENKKFRKYEGPIQNLGLGN